MSVSEPHINGTSVREFCIIIMVRRSREIICPAWLYGHKRKIFYCAFLCHGHRLYVHVRGSNLVNCIYFTLSLVLFAFSTVLKIRMPGDKASTVHDNYIILQFAMNQMQRKLEGDRSRQS